MNAIRWPMALFLCVGLTQADDRQTDAPKARKNRSGAAARRQQQQDISWHRGLPSALAAAQKEKPAKPILLVRALGELDDKL